MWTAPATRDVPLQKRSRDFGNDKDSCATLGEFSFNLEQIRWVNTRSDAVVFRWSGDYGQFDIGCFESAAAAGSWCFVAPVTDRQ